MNIESLFKKLPHNTDTVKQLLEKFRLRTRLNPPGKTDLDFPINRQVGRLADLRDAFDSLEVMRVQTRTPYTWNGWANAGDTSSGPLRSIKCEVRIEGVLPADEALVGRLLAGLLGDGFDFSRVFGRILDSALANTRDAIQGQFVREIRRDVSLVQSRLLYELQQEESSLGITRVELRPWCYDVPGDRDLFDDGSWLTFRTRDMLEENRVGYKARLGWGKTDMSHIVARLAYAGTIEGKVPTGPAKTAFVNGQTEPLEAWFRQLLAEELAKESLGDISSDGGLPDRVKLRVSERLALGTGRIVESLVIQLLHVDGPPRPDLPFQFGESYEIAGVGGAMLEALHTVRFSLQDRDRWIATLGQKKSANDAPPAPAVEFVARSEEFIKTAIVRATRLFLNERRFEDIVGLFLDQRKPKNLRTGAFDSFSQKITEHVTPLAIERGLRIVSTSALLTIPQQEFIDGQDIPLAPRRYALADPYLDPPIQLTAKVRMADGPQQNAFASALARHKALGKRLEQTIEESIGRSLAAVLRECSAQQYYGSRIVNGLPVQLPPPGVSSAQPFVAKALMVSHDSAPDPLLRMLKEAIDKDLKDQLGLQLMRLDLKPGEDDILIRRMRELHELRIDYPAEPGTTETFGVLRSEQDFIVRLEARGSIFIRWPSQAYWRSFQNSVGRFVQLDDHLNEIRGHLTKALRSLQTELMEAYSRKARITRDEAHDYINLHFNKRVEEQCGLVVRVPSLELFLVRPSVDRSSSAVVEGLKAELANLLKDRAVARFQAERDDLSQRIISVRAELKAEAGEYESEASQIVAVQVSQDLDDGKLLPAPESRALLSDNKSLPPTAP